MCVHERERVGERAGERLSARLTSMTLMIAVELGCVWAIKQQQSDEIATAQPWTTTAAASVSASVLPSVCASVWRLLDRPSLQIASRESNELRAPFRVV